MSETCTVASEDVRTLAAVVGMASKAFGSYLGQVPGFGAAIEALGRMEAAADQSQMPEDPVTSVQEVAIRQHTIMEAYLDAGFDRSEAFSLTHAHVAAAAMRYGHGG